MIHSFSRAFRFLDRRARSSGRSPPAVQRINPINGERYMRIRTGQASAFTVRPDLLFFVVAAIALLPLMAAAQGLTGSLTVRVRDEQGAAIQGATVRLISPVLMGGPATLITNERGQFRFPVLLPECTYSKSRCGGLRPCATGPPDRCGRDAGENGDAEGCRCRGVDRRRGSRLAHRRPKPRLRNPLRFRGCRCDSHATGDVGLRQGRAWRVADLALQQYRDNHLRVRLRDQRKPVSRRWHEHDLSMQRRRANGAWRRFHARSTGQRGWSVC